MTPRHIIVEVQPGRQLIINRFGLPGQPGTGGAAPTYVHSQPIASALWIINHNLDRLVDVAVTDLAGNSVGADVARPTTNQVRISSAQPSAGFALIK